MITYDPVLKEFRKTIDGAVSSLKFVYSDQDVSGNVYDIHKTSDYEIIEMYRDGVTAIEAAEVMVKQRIGCLIPELSLKTQIPEIENKSIYRFYSFLATSHLLEYYDEIFDDAHCDKRIFLIIEKANLPKHIEAYDCSLGLYWQGLYFDPNKINTIATSDPLPNKVKLKICSQYLRHDQYILKFLKRHIYESNPIKYFLYAYQIIEILIDDVLVDKLNEMIMKCGRGDLSLRSNIEESTELKRFRKILELTKTQDRPNLNSDCRLFLSLVGRDLQLLQPFPDSLYQVRNTIVHRLRLVEGNVNVLNSLMKVNEGFELLLLDILPVYYHKSSLTLHTELSFFKDIYMEKNNI